MVSNLWRTRRAWSTKWAPSTPPERTAACASTTRSWQSRGRGHFGERPELAAHRGPDGSACIALSPQGQRLCRAARQEDGALSRRGYALEDDVRVSSPRRSIRVVRSGPRVEPCVADNDDGR